MNHVSSRSFASSLNRIGGFASIYPILRPIRLLPSRSSHHPIAGTRTKQQFGCHLPRPRMCIPSSDPARECDRGGLFQSVRRGAEPTLPSPARRRHQDRDGQFGRCRPFPAQRCRIGGYADLRRTRWVRHRPRRQSACSQTQCRQARWLRRQGTGRTSALLNSAPRFFKPDSKGRHRATSRWR